MLKHILYVGLFDKDKHTQLIDTMSAFRMVSNIVPDCTITEGKGKYTHEDGTIVIEPTLIVEILDFDGSVSKESLKPMVEAIKTALNQEAVAYQKQKIESELM